MYTDPHPFAVDIPTLLSDAREASYEEFARPGRLSRALGRGPVAILVLTVAGTLLFALLAVLAGKAGQIVGGGSAGRSFYDVVPYGLMVIPMLLLTAFVVAAITAGVRAMWRESQGVEGIDRSAWWRAMWEVATLRWMKGGGDDCYHPTDEAPSALRRHFHHLTAYGFLLAFVATILAAGYDHLLSEPAPYPVLHPVVLFGLVGGIGMTVGTTGLLWLRRNAAHLGSRAEARRNLSFLIALDIASTSGIALLALRASDLMGVLLLIHLGAVFALFVSAPYGKFVHAAYRTAAVVRSAAERAHDGS
jgi:citrate/tricarballylate utilization protein